jgi:hypothetical protein
MKVRYADRCAPRPTRPNNSRHIVRVGAMPNVFVVWDRTMISALDEARSKKLIAIIAKEFSP